MVLCGNIIEFGQCVYQFYYCGDGGVEVVVVVVVVVNFVDGFVGFVMQCFLFGVQCGCIQCWCLVVGCMFLYLCLQVVQEVGYVIYVGFVLFQ